MLQLDGSTHKWFGDENPVNGVIDDANSDLHAEFFNSESTWALHETTKRVIQKEEFLNLFTLIGRVYGGPRSSFFPGPGL